MLIRLFAAMLLAAATTLSGTAQAAEPLEATAEFEQNLVHVPTWVVEGKLGFTETTDGKTKVTGEFKRGFGTSEAKDYRLVLVDNVGKIEHDLTKDFVAAVEVITPPAVDKFEFTLDAKTKDLLGLDCVVYQVIKVAGIPLLAETGRAPIKKI